MLHHLGRAAELLPLRRWFQAAEPATDTNALDADSPQAPSAISPLAWLPRPDPALLGKEEPHQLLLPCLFATLFLVGVVTASRGWDQISRARASAAWPYARGLILSSEVRALADNEGMRWRPIITYSYQAGRREVIGSRLSREEPVYGYEKAVARAYVTRYPQGAVVLVYYNPDNIGESVLEQSAPRSAYLGLYLGLMLATVGLLLLLLPRRRDPPEVESEATRVGA